MKEQQTSEPENMGLSRGEVLKRCEGKKEFDFDSGERKPVKEFKERSVVVGVSRGRWLLAMTFWIAW